MWEGGAIWIGHVGRGVLSMLSGATLRARGGKRERRRGCVMHGRAYRALGPIPRRRNSHSACSCLSCETFYGAPLAHTSLRMFAQHTHTTHTHPHTGEGTRVGLS